MDQRARGAIVGERPIDGVLGRPRLRQINDQWQDLCPLGRELVRKLRQLGALDVKEGESHTHPG